VDLDDPACLDFEYIRRIGHAIDVAFPPGAPVRALHLGGGAMTLPRYIAVTRPGSAQIVAETDTALTELVRSHLPLPGKSAGGGRIRVRAHDARQVLESARPHGYHLVVSDVFAGARTPFHMTTAQCAAAARRALRAGGIYAVNVADGPPLAHARAQVATISSVFPETAMIAEPGVLRGRRTGNLVLLASTGPLPVAELRRLTAADPFPARVVDGIELTRFASGAAPVTDADALPGSPVAGVSEERRLSVRFPKRDPAKFYAPSRLLELRLIGRSDWSIGVTACLVQKFSNIITILY
jgi:hypothetical protein